MANKKEVSEYKISVFHQTDTSLTGAVNYNDNGKFAGVFVEVNRTAQPTTGFHLRAPIVEHTISFLHQLFPGNYSEATRVAGLDITTNGRTPEQALREARRDGSFDTAVTETIFDILNQKLEE